MLTPTKHKLSPPLLSAPQSVAEVEPFFSNLFNRIDDLAKSTGRDPRPYILDALSIEYAQLALPRVARLLNVLICLSPLPLTFDLIELQAALNASLSPDAQAWLSSLRSTMGCFEISVDDDVPLKGLSQRDMTPDQAPLARWRLRNLHDNSCALITKIVNISDGIWRSRVVIAWRDPTAYPDAKMDARSTADCCDHYVPLIGYILDADTAESSRMLPSWDPPSWTSLLCKLLDPLKLGERAKLPFIPLPTAPEPLLISRITLGILSGAWGDSRDEIAHTRSPDDPWGARLHQRLLSLRFRLCPQIHPWPAQRLLSPHSPNLDIVAPLPLLLSSLNLLPNHAHSLMDGSDAADSLLLGPLALDILKSSPQSLSPPSAPSAPASSPSPPLSLLPSLCPPSLCTQLSSAISQWTTERRWLASWGWPWHASSPDLRDSPPSSPLPSYNDLLSAFHSGIFDPQILQTPLGFDPSSNSPRDERGVLSLLSSPSLSDLPPTITPLLSLKGMGPARIDIIERWLLLTALGWRAWRAPQLLSDLRAHLRQEDGAHAAKSALSEIEALLDLMR